MMDILLVLLVVFIGLALVCACVGRYLYQRNRQVLPDASFPPPRDPWIGLDMYREDRQRHTVRLNGKQAKGFEHHLPPNKVN